MHRSIALILLFLAAMASPVIPAQKVDLDLLRMAARQTERVPFNVGAVWTSMMAPPDTPCATCMTWTFNVWEPENTVYIRGAKFTAYFRSIPVGGAAGTAKVRLVSYYYDEVTGQPVFDRDWCTPFESIPNTTGDFSCWINGKLNAILTSGPNNPVMRQYHFFAEVWGSGELAGIRIEMQ